jgi:hypothetical protein
MTWVIENWEYARLNDLERLELLLTKYREAADFVVAVNGDWWIIVGKSDCERSTREAVVIVEALNHLENYGAEATLAAMRHRRSIGTAPKGIPVIVAGGVAMQKTGGQWFSGMEEPLYQRQLEWIPTWWMPIPSDSEAA